MVIEYYSHVMHISSNVVGEIEDGHDAMDALIAGFPAGPVSGAPKVRAMEIIDELEPDRSEEHTSQLQSLMRRSYAGSALNNKIHTSEARMDTTPAHNTAQ